MSSQCHNTFSRVFVATNRSLVLCAAIVAFTGAAAGCGFLLFLAPTPQMVSSANAFVDISDRLGPAGQVKGWGGLAAFDCDNDGDIDLLVTSGPGTPNRLFLNDGLANFTEAAEPAGLAMAQDNCSACGVGDFNNDGRLDLLIARQRIGLPDDAPVGAVLMINNGPGADGVVTFSELGSDQTGLNSTAAAMAIGVGDLDNDGMLDVLIGAYDMAALNGLAPTLPTQPDELWRCTGIVAGVPQFVRVTEAGIEGTEHMGATDETQDVRFVPPTLVFHLSDVDEDGFLDIFTLHDVPGGIDLFGNNGDMTFTALQSELLDASGGWMGMASGDYDGDGDIDYFATNLGTDAIAPPLDSGFVTATPFLPGGTPFHRLLRNDGGVLTDVTAKTPVRHSFFLPPRNLRRGMGLQSLEFGFGTTWIDADNGGWLDLFWIGDLLIAELPLGFRLDYGGVGRFLRNNGDGGFTDRTAERGLFNIPPDRRIAWGQNEFGHATAACDLNGDGFGDLVVINSDMLGTSPASMRVFLNPAGTGNHWITVRLTGTVSNRFGVGSRVRVTTGERTLVGEVLLTTGAFTGVQPEAHFGLGGSQVVDRLEVLWPSGATTVLADIPADQVLTVIE